MRNHEDEENIKEFKVLVVEMRHHCSNIDRKLSDLDNKLGAFHSTTDELDKVSLLLNTLPQKTERNIQTIAPVVAKAIQDQLTSGLEQKIRECHNAVAMAIGEVDELFNNNFKSKMKNLLLAITISTTCALGGSYYLMKSFPQRIFLQANGDVRVSNSSVSVINKPIGKARN